jgi:hypothetical protein
MVIQPWCCLLTWGVELKRNHTGRWGRWERKGTGSFGGDRAHLQKLCLALKCVLGVLPYFLPGYCYLCMGLFILYFRQFWPRTFTSGQQNRSQIQPSSTLSLGDLSRAWPVQPCFPAWVSQGTPYSIAPPQLLSFLWNSGHLTCESCCKTRSGHETNSKAETCK